MESKQEYAPGETIIAEGTYGSQTYLIHSGTVLICKETGCSSGRIAIATLGEGEVFGEMYLFDDTGFRTASVIAQSQVVVEVIAKEEMQKHLENTPQIMQSMIRTLSSRLAQTSQENSLLKLYKNQTLLERLYRKLTSL